MTPHNEAKLEDISPICIMPGDPLRAKYIAETYLTDYKLVNSIRNMYAYTGFYNGKRITVFSHGMGMPSMGIYAYELFKYYNVQKVIRIGSCGSYDPNIHLFDTILVDKSFTEGNFAYGITGREEHIASSSESINKIIDETAREKNIRVISGNILCSDIFDHYIQDFNSFYARLPKDLHLLGAEMESFALFYLAHLFNREAACLLTVVDSHTSQDQATPEQRQESLDNMIKLAFESAIKL
jgi:purine-nucleoside phosphorylase